MDSVPLVPHDGNRWTHPGPPNSEGQYEWFDTGLNSMLYSTGPILQRSGWVTQETVFPIVPTHLKKPVSVEAYQWFKNGDHPRDYLRDLVDYTSGQQETITKEFQKAMEFEGQVVRYFRHPDIDSHEKCKVCGDIMHNHGFIDQGNRGLPVCPGDYIITEADGKSYYPCRPERFAKLFNQIETKS